MIELLLEDGVVDRVRVPIPDADSVDVCVFVLLPLSVRVPIEVPVDVLVERYVLDCVVVPLEERETRELREIVGDVEELFDGPRVRDIVGDTEELREAREDPVDVRVVG